MISAWQKLADELKRLECDWCGKSDLETELYDVSEHYVDDAVCKECLEKEEYGD